MHSILDKIETIARATTESAGFFLIDLNVRGDKNKRIIEIYIDSETHLSAEDLAAVSREIQKKMDEEKDLDISYRLDVSSPGTDRPLKYLKQYPKHLNRKFEVNYTSENESKMLKGKLISIKDEDLFFLVENKQETKINFKDIILAKVIISFS